MCASRSTRLCLCRHSTRGLCIPIPIPIPARWIGIATVSVSVLGMTRRLWKQPQQKQPQQRQQQQQQQAPPHCCGCQSLQLESSTVGSRCYLCTTCCQKYSTGTSPITSALRVERLFLSVCCLGVQKENRTDFPQQNNALSLGPWRYIVSCDSNVFCCFFIFCCCFVVRLGGNESTAHWQSQMRWCRCRKIPLGTFGTLSGHSNCKSQSTPSPTNSRPSDSSLLLMKSSSDSER